MKLKAGANCEIFSCLKSVNDVITTKCDIMTPMHVTISDFHFFSSVFDPV